jgi:hypothetical protein
MENVVETKHVLVEGIDMTYPRFLDWLNENFEKDNGNKFTSQDVYGYVKRGNLPIHLGYYTLRERNLPSIGVKLIQINQLK